MEPAPILSTINNTAELSDLISNDTANYGKYHELVIKYNEWQEWYTTNQKLWDSLK